MQAISKFIGIPFEDRQSDYNGCDCWGLVRLVYRELLNIDLPDYAISCDDTSRVGNKIDEKRVEWEQTKAPFPPLALVVMRFNTVNICNHVGLYIGNGEILHTARKVQSHIVNINNPAWQRRIEGFYLKKGVEYERQ